MINIQKYTAYFHDGGLIDIQHIDEKIILLLESAETSLDEMQEDIALSEHSTIKGKLHIEGVKQVFDDEHKLSINDLKMIYDSGEILHFKIEKNQINLDVKWVNYSPNPNITTYSFYKIEADKIWWENIPDLYDPFD